MRVFAVFIIALVLQCAPALVFVDKKYVPPTGAKIAMVPIAPDNIALYNEGAIDVQKAFGGDSRSPC
jgi:hypothetical protein